VGYYLLYNLLFFVVHGATWSLSAFNSESLLRMFFNVRMAEAAMATVFAAAIAADIYLALRREPRRPVGEYLPGWLSLGVATVLIILATLALQVAWYLWQWGAAVTWIVPDLQWGFKYDLDLIQATAVGAAVLLAPLVTYLVGRYHPLRIGGRHSARSDRTEDVPVSVEPACVDAAPDVSPETVVERAPLEGASEEADAAPPPADTVQEAPAEESVSEHAAPRESGTGEPGTQEQTDGPEQLSLLDDEAPAQRRNPYESA
jgi:hypothetical protein